MEVMALADEHWLDEGGCNALPIRMRCWRDRLWNTVCSTSASGESRSFEYLLHYCCIVRAMSHRQYLRLECHGIENQASIPTTTGRQQQTR